MTPAPRMAVTWDAVMTCSPLLLGDQGPDEECQVLRSLRETSHEVAVPLGAVGDVDAHGLAGLGQAALLLGADAVQHLELVAPRAAAVPGGQGGGDLDHPGVVGGDHRVALTGHQCLE